MGGGPVVAAHNLEIDKMQSTATETKTGRVLDRWDWTVQPRVDMRELDDHVVVEVEIPGVAADKVDLQVEGDELRLTATKTVVVDGANYLVQERRYGTYCRVFQLGEHVNRDAIDAEVADGVLRIRVPKQATSLPRKISIKEQ